MPRITTASRRRVKAIDPGEELSRVAAALHVASDTGEKRLALLRRQAALGDLRDELALRARRRQADDQR